MVTKFDESMITNFIEEPIIFGNKKEEFTPCKFLFFVIELCYLYN